MTHAHEHDHGRAGGPDRVEWVESPGDPRVAEFVGLRNPDRRIAYEGDAGIFIGEGRLVVERLLAGPHRVRSVLAAAGQVDLVRAMAAGRPEVPVYAVSEPVLREIAGFDLHRGIVCAVDRFALPDPDALLAAHPTVLVGERISDHENLGALFRNAAALGAGALLLCPESADPLYRRSVRVSMGAAAIVPFGRLIGWPHTIAGLRAHGHEVVALSPRADAEPLRTWHPAPRTVLLVGAEGPGLRDEVMRGADRTVRIEMTGTVDSLNVATAAAMALHHVMLSRPSPTTQAPPSA